MAVKDARLYLDHMLTAIARIEQYTQDGRDAFMAAPMAQDAVSRNFEIIRDYRRSCEAHPDRDTGTLSGSPLGNNGRVPRCPDPRVRPD